MPNNRNKIILATIKNIAFEYIHKPKGLQSFFEQQLNRERMLLQLSYVQLKFLWRKEWAVLTIKQFFKCSKKLTLNFEDMDQSIF